MSLVRTGILSLMLAGFWDWGTFNMKVFSGCAALDLGVAAVFSFALGPAGPGFFFYASAAALANCSEKAYGK